MLSNATASSPKLVLLSDLAGAVARLTGHPSPKTYNQWWKMVVDGVLPAEKVSGRYWIDPHVAAEIAGLTEAV